MAAINLQNSPINIGLLFKGVLLLLGILILIPVYKLIRKQLWSADEQAEEHMKDEWLEGAMDPLVRDEMWTAKLNEIPANLKHHTNEQLMSAARGIIAGLRVNEWDSRKWWDFWTGSTEDEKMIFEILVEFGNDIEALKHLYYIGTRMRDLSRDLHQYCASEVVKLKELGYNI
ncbi:hypothetical protein KJK34_04655 [Flavobacterium sp. D11R37]|uniref:hypothetical protein n=1 Tax=Flavobacterium coralii TaxID=2838017 RepID=UPI001CA70518|nr:hypothetical protein [Flavobacterium coralii]MBY8962037.1 hypothetical protein [Flavobacterium coralii]